MSAADPGSTGAAGRVTAAGYAPDWDPPAWVRSWQTQRAGGVSGGPYASLNLGMHVGDHPERVQRNRARLGAGLPATPCWLEQVHGTRIVDLDRPWSGTADGAVTSAAGVVCAVMTADCLPVLFTARRARRIGVAHAGWRGLAAGVLPAAVAALGCDPGELVAWLGPAIGPEAFEVGDDVRDAFLRTDERSDHSFVRNTRGRWFADLYALARLSLETAGVGAVAGGGECTFTDADRFFSHRREAPCGRMATLIWID